VVVVSLEGPGAGAGAVMAVAAAVPVPVVGSVVPVAAVVPGAEGSGREQTLEWRIPLRADRGWGKEWASESASGERMG